MFDQFKEADVFGVVVQNGEARLQLGRGGTNKGLANGVPMWGPFGYYGIPNPASDGEAPSVIYLQEGSRLRAIAGRDNRYAALTGDMQPGDIMIVTQNEARVILKATGGVTLYTVNQKTGLSMMVNVDGVEGLLRLINGNAQISMEDKSIVQAVNGGGSITIDMAGVHVGGAQFNADTGGGTLGLIGNVRPPPGTNSIVEGPAGNVGVGSTTWTVAP